MAEAKIEKTPRFSGGDVAVVGVIAAIAVVVAVVSLVVVSSLFDKTVTTTTVTPSAGAAAAAPGAPGAPTTTIPPAVTKVESNELVTAQYAVVILILLGGLTVVAGFSVALAEVVVEKATTEAAEAEMRALDGTNATAIAAFVSALAAAAKALAEALRGLKPSSALALLGTLLMIMGGAIAWQTIPDTDRNPTIEVTEASTTTTNTTAPPRDPTGPTGPGTTTTTLTTPTTR